MQIGRDDFEHSIGSYAAVEEIRSAKAVHWRVMIVAMTN